MSFITQALAVILAYVIGAVVMGYAAVWTEPDTTARGLVIAVPALAVFVAYGVLDDYARRSTTERADNVQRTHNDDTKSF